MTELQAPVSRTSGPSGIGVDVCRPAEYRKFLRSDTMIGYLLAPAEIEKMHQLTSESRRVEFLAGRFCAKEALYKSLPRVVQAGFRPSRVTIPLSGPKAVFSNEALGEPSWVSHISISHIRDLCVAISATHRIEV